jgi:hypothetical protein
LLSKINTLSNNRSYTALSKEQYIQTLLGVPSSTSQASAQRGRGARGRGGRGRERGRGGFAQTNVETEEVLTPEDHKLFRDFALCIEEVLKSVGRERRGLNWEFDAPEEEMEVLQ